jgi:TRAP-type C4-dicarboxylate transport system substrate-binding protein
MKLTKYLIALSISLILAVSLLIGACTPAAPSNGDGDGNGAKDAEIAALKADIADLEDDLDAKDDEIKDLEDDLAALQKPAKVYRWEPAVWINAGTPWDFLVYLSEYVNEASDGRIVSTPSAVGAVAPAEELMEAVSDGTTQAMLPTPSYYAGKFPMAAVYNTCIGIPSALDMQIVYEIFEGGRASELYYNACETLYNVKVAGQRIGPVNAIMSLSTPISRIADLQGMKFRCGDDHFAAALNAHGASTVWAPGSEIYTMLATGVVDGFTYGSAYDHYGMSFHEVTDYWVRSPLAAANNEQFVINIDIWNEMDDDLKAITEAAIATANWRTNGEAIPIFAETWNAVADYGVTIVDWPAEDSKSWNDAMTDWVIGEYGSDPDVAEFFEIIGRYGELIGL